jgi:hypothetical protein
MPKRAFGRNASKRRETGEAMQSIGSALSVQLGAVELAGSLALSAPETGLDANGSNAVAVIPAASCVALTFPPVLAGSLTPEIRSRVKHF